MINERHPRPGVRHLVFEPEWTGRGVGVHHEDEGEQSGFLHRRRAAPVAFRVGQAFVNEVRKPPPTSPADKRLRGRAGTRESSTRGAGGFPGRERRDSFATSADTLRVPYWCPRKRQRSDPPRALCLP